MELRHWAIVGLLVGSIAALCVASMTNDAHKVASGQWSTVVTKAPAGADQSALVTGSIGGTNSLSSGGSGSLTVIVLLAGLCSFFVGLSRMGFAAGLAWFIGVILLFAVAWPLALIAAGAITVYGLGSLGTRREASQ